MLEISYTEAYLQLFLVRTINDQLLTVIVEKLYYNFMTGSLARHATNKFRWSRKKLKEAYLNSAWGCYKSSAAGLGDNF